VRKSLKAFCSSVYGPLLRYGPGWMVELVMEGES
jgi:hypothetical protein